MKKNYSVAVWSCARLTSKRCPKKMIRNFCGTTLTDIFLKKMQIIQKKGINVFFGGYDEVFKSKCKVFNDSFSDLVQIESQNSDQQVSVDGSNWSNTAELNLNKGRGLVHVRSNKQGKGTVIINSSEG